MAAAFSRQGLAVLAGLHQKENSLQDYFSRTIRGIHGLCLKGNTSWTRSQSCPWTFPP